MKASAKSSYAAEIEGKKIEEKGAIRFGCQRNHLALLRRPGMVVDPLQIGSFPAESGTVVDKFAVNLARRKINKRHNSLRVGLPITYSTGGAYGLRRGWPLFATDN